MTDRGERPDAGPVIAATATSATPTTSATSATAAPAVPVSTAGPAAPVPTAGPAGAGWWAQLPYALVLAATAGGLAWIWLGTRNVHMGMMTVASALLAAALFRLVLPERAAGLLVSRRRVADVLALASLGACIMAAVLVLPAPS